MQSSAKDVDSYLKEVPKERLEAIKMIRQICLEELKGYKEIMFYGGPCYEKNGVIEAGFASQKNFIGLYILKQDVFNAHKDELKGISLGKGVIRYNNPGKINYEVVRKLLADTRETADSICGHNRQM